MNPHWDEDYYQLLGVGRSATLSEIATAYHAAKNTYSKDSPATYSLFSAEESQAMLSKLEQAYLTLSNIDKKRDYDRWLDNELRGSRIHSDPGPMARPNERSDSFSSLPADVPAFFQSSAPPTPSPELPEEKKTVAADPPTEVPSGAVDGAQLKLIRERLGLTVDDVCRITKIPSRYLKAIESSHPEELPARVYLQGFIKNLAKLYHLDPKLTVQAYLKSIP